MAESPISRHSLGMLRCAKRCYGNRSNRPPSSEFYQMLITDTLHKQKMLQGALVEVRKTARSREAPHIHQIRDLVVVQEFNELLDPPS